MKKKSFFSILTVMLISIATVSFYGCDKDKGGDDNGGGNGGGEKTDPGTIAAANLIAYFPMNGNGDDVIGGLKPAETGTGVKYATGRRGQAYQGGANAFFLYDLPSTSKLVNPKAISWAGWFKFQVNPGNTDEENVPEGMIMQLNGSSDATWGNLAFQQSRKPKEDDKFLDVAPLKAAVYGSDGNRGWADGPRIQQVNKWVHVAFAYDNVTSTMHVYSDGAPMLKEDGEPWTFPFAAGDPAVSFGDLKFENVTKLAIGDWMANIVNAEFNEPWAKSFIGQIDELRVYDKGLTAAEVKALYDAEVENID